MWDCGDDGVEAGVGVGIEGFQEGGDLGCGEGIEVGGEVGGGCDVGEH